MNDANADPFAPLTVGEERLTEAPPTPEADAFVAILPALEPQPSQVRHRRLGSPTQIWPYENADGRLLFAVCRFDLSDGSKEVLPYTYGIARGRNGWHWRAPPAPRPLYRLNVLAARPAAPVIVTEGEKAADAAARLFPEYVAITSPSGARAAAQADWSPLRGREVTIWPDADAAGLAYATHVAELVQRAGAARVAIVRIPGTWPEGWDLADAPPPGFDTASVCALIATADAADAPAMQPAPMPPGFVEKQAGIFVKSDDPEKPDLHVCGKLHVLAATHDGSGEDWGALLHWQDADGRAHEWAMPRAMLAGDATDVRGRLLGGGLYVGTSPKAREALATYLMRAKPLSRVRIVRRLGWHETPRGRVFVLPACTIAPPGAETVRLQSERVDTLPPIAERGTLAEWQEAIAAPAVGNSRLALALSMSFAAPLLGIVGAEGGGVHLRGGSSVGKSTAVLAAGTVWGGGGLHGWLQRWRATDNGLEGLAAAHCDLLLTLDELGEVDPRHLGTAAYMLANGRGKVRAARDGGGRKPAEWRLLFLSSGEVSIADRLAELVPGRRAAAGQEVRIVDLPADAGAGFGLFETLHGAAGSAAFADRIKAAASAFYGTAGPAFLRALMADIDGAAAAVRRYRREFADRYLGTGVDGQVARVADRFALIAAGGELAVAFGILPWPGGEASRAAADCFAAWRRQRGGDGPAELAAGLAQVRHFLEVHGEGRFRRLGGDDDAPQPDGAERMLLAGFRRETADGTEYMIFPEVWKNEVAVGFDARFLTAAMVRLGFLRPDPGDQKPQRRCVLPGRTKGARAYNVLPAIFADPACC